MNESLNLKQSVHLSTFSSSKTFNTGKSFIKRLRMIKKSIQTYIMFTLEQIENAHSKFKSGADFHV